MNLSRKCCIVAIKPTAVLETIETEAQSKARKTEKLGQKSI
jgi:hypothetical protein